MILLMYLRHITVQEQVELRRVCWGVVERGGEAARGGGGTYGCDRCGKPPAGHVPLDTAADGGATHTLPPPPYTNTHT